MRGINSLEEKPHDSDSHLQPCSHVPLRSAKLSSPYDSSHQLVTCLSSCDMSECSARPYIHFVKTAAGQLPNENDKSLHCSFGFVLRTLLLEALCFVVEETETEPQPAAQAHRRVLRGPGWATPLQRLSNSSRNRLNTRNQQPQTPCPACATWWG